MDLGSPESVGMSHDRIQNLTSVLNKYVENKKLAAVALIARRGKIVYFESVGQMDIEKKIPMSRNTIFRIASQTKAIVSVGIMMLQEEGKLLISDPVGDYIPEFEETKVAVPKEGGGYIIEKAKRPITIRDLLTHTAGIGYGDGEILIYGKRRVFKVGTLLIEKNLSWKRLNVWVSFLLTLNQEKSMFMDTIRTFLGL